MVDVVTVFDIFDILTLTGGTKYVKIGQRDWRGCRGLLNIVKELQRRCWEAKRDIVTLWHCDWHCGFLRVFKFGKGSVVRQKRDGQCEWLTLRVLEMLTHLKTDILGQYFTQYWSDLYYTAMFNSSVSTHVFQLLLCTLSTKLGYIIIVLKFSHFLKIYENSSPISANLAQCDLIRFSLFPQFYLPSMIVTSTQANCYHIVKSSRQVVFARQNAPYQTSIQDGNSILLPVLGRSGTSSSPLATLAKTWFIWSCSIL